MIKRNAEKELLELLKYFPAIALVGPRQVGKTTLVQSIRKKNSQPSVYLDLEKTSDYNKLTDPETYLLNHTDKLVIIDEVQRFPGLFPVLRSLIDQGREPGRFILLGSAGPDLIRDSSESLAGRIAYLELSPLQLQETYTRYSMESLWLRGGFPDPFLEKAPWLLWMNNFVKTYLERDLPNLGFPGTPQLTERLWTMLAHYHANVLNNAELSRSLEVSNVTVKKYIDFLEQAFLVRVLRPYTANIKKRLVKSPKVYIRDSGILHFLLGINNTDHLINHPKMGASWEGFVIDQIAINLPLQLKMYYYRSHQGAELDMLIEKAGMPYASIEIKYGSDVRLSRGNIEAVKTLQTKHNFIITASGEDYMVNHDFRVCKLHSFLTEYLPKL